MKIRLSLTLAGLAIGFAVATFAQQQNTPDPILREQVLALAKKIDEAWNSNDAAALAALFTDDAIEVRDTGPIYGRDALQKNWADMYQQVHMSNHISTVDQYSPHNIGTAGNEVWMNGKYSVTLKGQNFGPVDQKGYWCLILVREGDAWKTRMQIWNVTPAPAAPAQMNASPTSAQEKNTVDPQLRQQIEPLMMKFQEAYNSRDAATIGALLTQDAIEVRSWPAEYRGGLASGREALQKRFEADFATNPGKMVNQLVQLYPIGSAICEITNSDVGGWKAQTVAIWVRDGDTWKSRMTYVNNQPNVVDPQLRQQIEAPFLKFQEAYNNRDAAAIGALLTQDAIEVRSWQGLASGREAQEKMFETDFATDPGKMVNKLVALYPTGSAMCEIADSDVGEWKGQTMVIYVRDGNTWKRCMAYVNDQR